MPRDLTWDEFRERLRKAGWKEHEIEVEIAALMADEEAGE